MVKLLETQRIISSISLIVQNSSAQLKFKKYWLHSFKNNLWSSGDSFNWEDINSYRNFFILVTTDFDNKTDFDKKILFQLNLSDVTFCSNRFLLSFNFKLGNNCSHFVGKRFVILITFVTFSVFCLMFCRIFLVIKKKGNCKRNCIQVLFSQGQKKSSPATIQIYMAVQHGHNINRENLSSNLVHKFSYGQTFNRYLPDYHGKLFRVSSKNSKVGF